MIHLIQHIWYVFLNWTGSNNTSGNQYGFWSGFGSDIAELAILGGVVQMFHAHNCHVKGCPRIGKHPVDGTPYKVCRRHHPDLPEEITYTHIFNAHRKAKEE